MRTFQALDFNLHSHTSTIKIYTICDIKFTFKNIYIIFIHLERKNFFSTACYSSIRIKYHIWKTNRYHTFVIFHIRIIHVVSQHHYLLEASSFLFQSQRYSFMKKMFTWVTLLGEKILGSLEVEWDWRIEKGRCSFSQSKGKRTLDLCRLNKTTNAALSSTNDVNAIADSDFGSILFAICKAFFFQRGWLISTLPFEFSINSTNCFSI